VLNKDIALFPPVVLDNLSASSWWESGNNVLKHYRVFLGYFRG